ncbi:MAG: hypothetical protein MJE77_25775 [Proteobacteria bacterium]|nr:hypothetical protein [Pseudomonadota bacterium]
MSRTPVVLRETVEATADWARTGEWDLVITKQKHLTVRVLGEVLQGFLRSFPGAHLNRLSLFVESDREPAQELSYTGETLVESLLREHDDKRVSNGAEVEFSLRLWWQDEFGMLEQYDIEPAGRMAIIDDGGLVRVVFTVSVNVYSSRILLYSVSDHGLRTREVPFAAAAEKNREYLKQGIKAWQSRVDATIESWESEMLKDSGIESTGIAATAQLVE